MRKQELLGLAFLFIVALVYGRNKANLASGRINLNGGNEYGYTLCQDGCHLTKGSEGSGHRTGVSLSVGCPSGGNPIGLYHTHPGGTTEPSDQDIREMRRLGLNTMCIRVPETRELDCYHVDQFSVNKYPH